jgi:flagellar export protein FliJ
MAVSRGLRRVLEIRRIREEQSQAALDAALGDLRRLEAALELSLKREREGRRLLAASAVSGNVVDRIAGLAETRNAERRESLLKPRIEDAEDKVGERRAEFLEMRMERQQAETLIEHQKAREALDGARQAQRDSDDWFLGKFHHAQEDLSECESTPSEDVAPGKAHEAAEKLE